MRFSENLAHWFGRVELLALGAEDERREAALALARGDFMTARTHAKSLLARVPGSKIGLALWADAAEGAGLADDLVEALTPLAEAMPWRADPWLRLARAKRRAGGSEGEVREALERAAMATEGLDARRQALLDLCDLDGASNDPARASRWLDRLSLSEDDPEVALRVAEHALARGEIEKARQAQSKLGPASPSDGRRALVEGRLRAHAGDARAFDWLVRAFVLDAPFASAELASYVASSRDAVLVQRARAVVAAAGHQGEPRWAAAFALSEGRGEDARRALREGARARDPEASRALLDWALRERDPRALSDATTALDDLGEAAPPFVRSLLEALSARARGDESAALDFLDAITEGPGAAWRDELRAEAMRAWLPREGEARWPSLLTELQRSAKVLDRLQALRDIEAIAIERERPLRVAIVGEFNAGKSTFLNALLGEDVAPTGILPTTATLHWVAWAADPFARIVVRNAPDRVVAHAELKRTLRELAAGAAEVERVFIHAPIELLRRIELLDTPGLNSGDASHTEAARAAFDEAHLAIWLLDATQPLKESERATLAEVAKTGLPILVLLNKRDRLSEAQLSTALAYVREGLEEAGLVSYAEPVAFSAKVALVGRGGDEEAFSRSHWKAIEALLETIVASRVPLRERALRRRALTITNALVELAEPRAREEEREREARGAYISWLRQASTRLEESAEAGIAQVRAALREPLQRLEEDLKPLLDRGGRGEGEGLSEGALRYAMDRAALRLTDALVVACLAVAEVDGLDAAHQAALAAQARALLLGAMSMVATRTKLELPDPTRLAMAALPTMARALHETASLPASASPAVALAARLQSLRAALACCPEIDRAG